MVQYPPDETADKAACFLCLCFLAEAGTMLTFHITVEEMVS